MKICLGDIQIELRDWPTPDPKKCAIDDQIGILTRGTILPGEEGSHFHILRKFFPCEGEWYLSGQAAWSHPSRLGATLDDYAGDGRSWRPWAHPGGWFWMNEPASLVWNIKKDEGHRSFFSRESSELGRLLIKERVEGRTTMHYDYVVQSELSSENWSSFLELDHAKRFASSLMRDMKTKRTG